MLTTKMVKHIVQSLILACGISGLASCSMMSDEEKLDGCPTGDFVVQFVYDYNIQRADMFRDHVGEIALYVFDENGKFVTQREINNREQISNRDQRCQIIFRAGDDPNDPKVELLAGGKYHFVAIAGQSKDAIIDTDEALPVSLDNAERARYRHSHYSVNSHEDDLRVALDRSATPDEFGRYEVNCNQPLDTLWHTLGILHAGQHSTDDPNFTEMWRNDPLVKIRENIYDFENIELHSPEDTLTISLIRDTKHLHVALKELDKPAEVNAEDYEVYIEDANGLMNVHNEMLADQRLIYRPYHARTTDESDAYLDAEEGVKYTSAHWDMMFNRIIYHEKAEDDARLMIVRKSDNEVVAKLSLPRILAYDRIANYYYHLTQQGYLDREYNYNLTFFLKGGEWESTEIWTGLDVNILSWNVRRQDIEL